MRRRNGHALSSGLFRRVCEGGVPLRAGGLWSGRLRPSATRDARSRGGRIATMSRSFYATNKYGQLYTGSNAFSTQISATPTAFGLVSAQASSYAALNEIFAEAYLAAENPETRTKGS